MLVTAGFGSVLDLGPSGLWAIGLRIGFGSVLGLGPLGLRIGLGFRAFRALGLGLRIGFGFRALGFGP